MRWSPQDGCPRAHLARALRDSGTSGIGVSPNTRPPSFDGLSLCPTFGGSFPRATSTDCGRTSCGSISADSDILTHLVGGFAGNTIAQTGQARFERMLELNLNSAFTFCARQIPHRRRAGARRIVGLGNRAAQDPGRGVGAYSASQAALVSFIRTVALENKDPAITANLLLPGTMGTPANRQPCQAPAPHTGCSRPGLHP